MSKFLICECCNQTYLEEDMSKNNKNMCCCCWCFTRPKDKRIAELEEQLKNATVPKFKRGQEVYTYNKYQGCIYKLHLTSIHIEQYETTEFDTLVYRARRLKDGFIGGYLEEELFATEEEALAKLEELQAD